MSTHSPIKVPTHVSINKRTHQHFHNSAHHCPYTYLQHSTTTTARTYDDDHQLSRYHCNPSPLPLQPSPLALSITLAIISTTRTKTTTTTTLSTNDNTQNSIQASERQLVAQSSLVSLIRSRAAGFPLSLSSSRMFPGMPFFNSSTV